MATRRPRIKAAAILKPRRAQQPVTTDQQEQNSNEAIKLEFTVETKTELPSTIEFRNSDIAHSLPSSTIGRLRPSDIRPMSPAKNRTNGTDKMAAKDAIEIIPTNEASIDSGNVNPVPVSVATIKNENTLTIPFKPPGSNPSNESSSANSTKAGSGGGFRRLSTPTVNMVNRRKSILNSENRQFNILSPNHLKSPPYSFSRDNNSQCNRDTKPNGSPYHGSSGPRTPNVDDEVFTSIAVSGTGGGIDGDFKSPPFMSPSIYSRRGDPSMSPFNDAYTEDYTKSPSSVAIAKMRQRIRPTPCFASRRNSINCSVTSDVEDDQNRRQRHYSTSSTHSNYNPATTPQHPRSFSSLSKPHSRIRTESYSSSVSDAPYIRELTSKMKRSHRSEEYQRVANAKREFNQKLNGKTPDKSRLTMYDLIYYNPLTNPMKKPAGKGDKSSDTSSMASARTNQSRSSGSVKSEASSNGPVKAEQSDPVTEPMPVPQLKLGANGEIVLDEKSLVIETTTDKEAREILANTDVVIDDEYSGTSGFYKRQKRTRDWLPLETIKFYRSLQTIGTDFSVMLQLFPNRSRRDLKLKFKKEEKYNMALINKALLHPKEFNVDELKLQFDQEEKEIELKKQEWAEIRKKMHTERKEQLSISKKRLPTKQISATMRNLTDGDMIYENEFVTMPKARRSKRKRQLSSDVLEDSTTKNLLNDLLLSPMSLNHNNNHVDALPTHTYATHKLPSFTEMLSTQKSTKISSPVAYTSQNSPSGVDTRQSNKLIDEDTTSQNGISEIHSPASPLPLPLRLRLPSPLPSHHQNGTATHIIINNETLIDRYGDKNPNLNLKNDSEDIMNMDIIFENVPIEEDTSVIVEAHSPLQHIEANRSNSLDSSKMKAESSSIGTTADKVNINGVQYEIITLNENQKTNEATNVINIEEVQNTIDSDQYVFNTNDVVIVAPPVLDASMPAEVDTIDTNYSSVNAAFNPENSSQIEQSSITNEADVKQIVIKSENASETKDIKCDMTTERKRKRKIVPVLNKRPRRPNLNEPVAEIAAATTISAPEHQSLQSLTSSQLQRSDQQVSTQPESDLKSTETQIDIEPNIVKTEEETEKEIKAETSTASNEDDNFMNSLVVVESQDPNDVDKIIHEVFVIDPITKQMSERPLDLPDDVIQRIRLSM